MTAEPYDAKARAADRMDLYDPDDFPMQYFTQLRDAEVAGLEPFATAMANAIVSLSDRWLKPGSMTAVLSRSIVVPYYDRTGRIRQATEATASAIHSLAKIDSIDASAQRYLLNFAKHLSSTRRFDFAEFVFQKLLKAAQYPGQSARAAEMANEYALFAEQRNVAESDNSEEQTHDVIVLAAEALEREEYGAAMQSISELVNQLSMRAQVVIQEVDKDIYKNADHKRHYRTLWNCLSYFARLLLDKERFSEADILGKALVESFVSVWSEDAALLSVLFDRAIHARQFALVEEREWEKIEFILASEPSFARRETSRSAYMPLNRPYELGYKLRQFALAYSFCGEAKRALTIMECSYAKTFSPLSELELEVRNQSLREHEVAEFYAHADLASIAIKSMDFKLANLAIDKLCSLKEVQSIFGTADKTLQIADAYIAGNRADDARTFLERVCNSEPGIIESRAMGCFRYHWKLATVAAISGDNRLAYQIATRSLEMTVAHMVPNGLSLLCAKMARLCADHPSSARYYLSLQNRIESEIERERTYSSFALVEPFYNDIAIQLLENALEADDRESCLDKEVRAGLYIVLANIYANSDHEIAKSLLSQALQLVPSNTKLSAEIFLSLSNLNRDSKEVEKSLQQEEWSAALAEQADPAQAYKKWLSLAQNELLSGNVNDAVKHIDHALKLYSKFAKPDRGNFVPVLTVKDGEIIDLLCKKKNVKAAEKLLRKSIAAIGSVYGQGSQNVSWGYCELAYFCALQKNFSGISKLVKPIVVGCTGSGHDFEAILRRLDEIAGEIDDSKHLELKISLLSWIILLFKKGGRNKFLISLPIKRLSEIHIAKGELAEGAALMRDALFLDSTLEIWFPSWVDDYKSLLAKMGESITDDPELVAFLADDSVKNRFRRL
ncbi:MAG: DUF2989 domain-containing protein [Candidatus Obscuribacterales bacterium]|nr:DUF2989 domain-containing protein [Candidatus Obscuribacterales bacterium]